MSDYYLSSSEQLLFDEKVIYLFVLDQQWQHIKLIIYNPSSLNDTPDSESPLNDTPDSESPLNDTPDSESPLNDTPGDNQSLQFTE